MLQKLILEEGSFSTIYSTYKKRIPRHLSLPWGQRQAPEVIFIRRMCLDFYTPLEKFRHIEIENQIQPPQNMTLKFAAVKQKKLYIPTANSNAVERTSITYWRKTWVV